MTRALAMLLVIASPDIPLTHRGLGRPLEENRSQRNGLPRVALKGLPWNIAYDSHIVLTESGQEEGKEVRVGQWCVVELTVRFKSSCHATNVVNTRTTNAIGTLLEIYLVAVMTRMHMLPRKNVQPLV